jgi:site-specific recombinase XerD
VLFAEGKTRRTALERRQTLSRLEEYIGRPAVVATADDVAEWLARDRHTRSAITVASDLSKLRAFFRWSMLAGLRHDDPTAQIKAPRRPRRQPRPITDAQFWRLDAAAAGNASLRAMVRLAGLCGLRVHEVARFHGTRDLDLEQATIRVLGKGGHEYTLPAHPAIIELAKRMPRGYWFPSQRARHLGGREVSQRLRLHMIRNKVSGTPHCLRHYFATEMLARGVDVRTVQELMRHSQLSTTAIYLGIGDERKRAAIDLLGPPAEVGQ